MTLLADAEWMTLANCATTDPEVMFPESKSSADAKAVCGHCDVVASCLAYALANNMRDGVWGDTTQRQRRKMLKRLKA